jgi:hypothetical protein
MTAVGCPATAQQLAARAQEGEGQVQELRRSTGELKQAMQALCAFLNGSGERMPARVRSEGTIEAQAVSDHTLLDIAKPADRFEPAAPVSIHRVCRS